MQRRSAADTSRYPRFSTGPIVTVQGDVMGAGVGSPTPQTDSGARAAVRELKSVGVHAIKIGYDDLRSVTPARPLMQLDVLRALIDEAHRVGLRAYVHAPMFPAPGRASRRTSGSWRLAA